MLTLKKVSFFIIISILIFLLRIDNAWSISPVKPHLPDNFYLSVEKKYKLEKPLKYYEIMSAIWIKDSVYLSKSSSDIFEYKIDDVNKILKLESTAYLDLGNFGTLGWDGKYLYARSKYKSVLQKYILEGGKFIHSGSLELEGRLTVDSYFEINDNKIYICCGDMSLKEFKLDKGGNAVKLNENLVSKGRVVISGRVFHVVSDSMMIEYVDGVKKYYSIRNIYNKAMYKSAYFFSDGSVLWAVDGKFLYKLKSYPLKPYNNKFVNDFKVFQEESMVIERKRLEPQRIFKPTGLAFDGNSIWAKGKVGGLSGYFKVTNTKNGEFEGLMPLKGFTKNQSVFNDTSFTWDGEYFNTIGREVLSDSVRTVKNSLLRIAPVHDLGTGEKYMKIVSEEPLPVDGSIAGISWSGETLWISIYQLYDKKDKGVDFYGLKKSDGKWIVSETFNEAVDFNTGLMWDGKFLWANRGTTATIYQYELDKNFKWVDRFKKIKAKSKAIRDMCWDGEFMWAGSTQSYIHKIDIVNSNKNISSKKEKGGVGAVYEEVSPNLVFNVKVSDSDRDGYLAEKEDLKLEIEIINRGQGTAENLKVLLNGEAELIEAFSSVISVGILRGKEQKQYVYRGKMPASVIPGKGTLNVSLSAARGFKSKMNKTLDFEFGSPVKDKEAGMQL